MRVGDIVKPRGFSGGQAGIVRLVADNQVAVRWTLGSGWSHVAWYKEEELEVKS